MRASKTQHDIIIEAIKEGSCWIVFLLQLVYDTLPSPANLHIGNPACKLCRKQWTILGIFYPSVHSLQLNWHKDSSSGDTEHSWESLRTWRRRMDQERGTAVRRQVVSVLSWRMWNQKIKSTSHQCSTREGETGTLGWILTCSVYFQTSLN